MFQPIFLVFLALFGLVLILSCMSSNTAPTPAERERMPLPKADFFDSLASKFVGISARPRALNPDEARIMARQLLGLMKEAESKSAVYLRSLLEGAQVSGEMPPLPSTDEEFSFRKEAVESVRDEIARQACEPVMV